MKALIVWGGWDGHTPRETAEVLAAALRENGFEVEISSTLDAFSDEAHLASFDVVSPVWTMGSLTAEQWRGLNQAVRGGVGFAGVHGGAGDAFRDNLEYQWMVGGQFVGHPHTGDYTVRLTRNKSPITRGMKSSFRYKSEQYYMIVDPGIRILAETIYRYNGQNIKMPVIWTKTWGKGRVFYSSLGHCAQEFRDYPAVLDMTVKGFRWAAEGKAAAGR